MDKRQVIFVVALTAAFFVINHLLFPPRTVSAPPAPIEQVEPSQTVRTPTPSPAHAGEEFYVLENGLQQLVFSNLGGAISEINLVLKSKEVKESVVRPIEVDRLLAKEDPTRDLFPGRPALTPGGGMQQGTAGGYYPLLRRQTLPRYYSCATLSPASPDPVPFRLRQFTKTVIEFEGVVDGVAVRKTYTLPDDPNKTPYALDLTIDVSGPAEKLALFTGVPEVELISGSASPSLKYRYTKNKRPFVEQVKLPSDPISTPVSGLDWISNSNGFFSIIIDPLADARRGRFEMSKVPGTLAVTRLSAIDPQYQLYPAADYPGYEMSIPLTHSGHFRLFAGPLATSVLDKLDTAYRDPTTGEGSPQYILTQSNPGWFSFISEPFAKFLFFLMKIFHAVTWSWGVSIILITVVIRLLLYPLNAWSIRSSLKIQKVAPKIEALKEKFKKDPKRMQMEIMQLYKSQGVNPMGGCLPLLLQMPFLLGMFDLLKTTFELRGAGFIPGWIDNLTAPDVIFRWDAPIWFFGNALHLLPFLLGITTYIQQKSSMKLPADKSTWTDQQKQQRMMGNMMTIVFTVLFYHFPSGLNLYWLSSLLLGILQQWWMTQKKAPAVEIIAPPPRDGASKKGK
jgi:YidC/Oxa1 family membrane protein insertase